MQVTISVGGQFHAFFLAEQLQKRGYLQKLITSYPSFKISGYSIPKGKVVSLPLKEILRLGLQNIPYLGTHVNLQRCLCRLFELQASRYIEPCDIFVGWSSFSLESLRKARSLGAITIIERGSTHIEFQRDILKKEDDLLGIKLILPHPRIIEKELQEYQEADYISIASNFVKRTFLEKGIPEEKLIRVPYGVDIDLFRPISKRDNIFRIIYAGGITIRKGVHYLLRAVSELGLKNFETCLMGSIAYEIKPLLKKYSKNFRYLGRVRYKKLYRYYSYGSVFVMPSVEEGMAMVMLQAMACGLPVICTTNTGGEDIVRDGVDGFIIPIRDLKALREKILYLYENPSICYEMGRQARERVKNNFTWDNYGEKIIKCYEKALNERRN